MISLFDEGYEKPFDEEFVRKLLCKDMTKEDIAELQIPVTYEELAKMAIKNCDGVIINGDNVSPALVEYAKEQGKAILERQAPEEFGEKCYSFYNTLLEQA